MSISKSVILILLLAFVSGCTTSLPVTNTGTPNEYVVVARNSASVFSSLEEAQKEAESKAMFYCTGMGKVYVKKYSLDRPMAIAQVPESSLYFTCKKEGAIGNAPNQQVFDKVVRPESSKDMYTELTKLDELRKKGIISEAEFEAQKKKILNAN